MERYDKLMASLAEKGVEAGIINRPENMRYISGYTGEGCLFVCKGGKVVVTDFRYTEQAERQAPGWRVELTTADRPQWHVCAELMAEFGLKTAGTETDGIIYDDYVELKKELGVDIASISGIIEKQREIKDAAEIENISEAARIACRAFDNMLGVIKAGMTEKEVQIALDYEMLKLGSEHNAFSTIACSGVNGSLPHAIPSDHVIQKGELLTLDFGACKNGYLSDMTRTVGIGKIEGELKTIYQMVYDAHMMALEAVKPGMVCRDIDKIARDFIDERYPGRFGHGLGHGVGLLIHEGPRLSTKCETVLQPGHVVTVEPGIYIPGLGGCRIEDTVVVTEDGFMDPFTSTKELVEL